MLTRHRNKIAALVVVLVVALGSAGAIAATGALSPREESQAVVNDAAERLGVQPSELSNALKAALKARIDAAVEAGRLTEAEGNEIKARIDSGDFPLFGPGGRGDGPGFGHGPGFGPAAELEAAASYLGMTEAQLRAAREEGKTLAQVAQERGKSVDGLVDALVNAATEDLEQAVQDGRLTEAQKDSIVAGLRERITAMVNGEFGRGPGRAGFGPPDGWGPPGDWNGDDQDGGSETNPAGLVA